MGISIFKIELEIMSGEKKSYNYPSPPFKEKEKQGEDRSKAWWPMEGEGEGKGSHAWRPMEGEGEGSHVWRPMECSKLGGQWKVKEKYLFTSSHFPPTNFT